MALSFEIFPAAGLVYVRYGRVARVRESQEAFQAYLRHKDFRPAQKQFIDLSPVEEIEHDFVALMKLQAQKAAPYVGSDAQTLIAYYAPTEPAMELAKYTLRAWTGLPHVVATIQVDEAAALGFLGRPERSLQEFFETT